MNRLTRKGRSVKHEEIKMTEQYTNTKTGYTDSLEFWLEMASMKIVEKNKKICVWDMVYTVQANPLSYVRDQITLKELVKVG